MNKCIICGKECVGGTCSGACRAKKSRTRTVEAHGIKRTQPEQKPLTPENKDSVVLDDKQGLKNTPGLIVSPELDKTHTKAHHKVIQLVDTPSVIQDRYARGEAEYNTVIDRLLNHTLDKLKEMNVWIPCWRSA